MDTNNIQPIKDQTINEFCQNLACKKPTPGGGSIAALQGALGCGLIAMVADLTIGKEKYCEFENLNKDVLEKSRTNKEKFLELIDKDIEAYSKMQGVFALPKDTEEEKALRQQKLQETLKNCAIPPYETLKLAAQSIDLIQEIFGKSNLMAQSDLGCAATNLSSCMQNAWLNIIANTNYIKDADFVNKYEIDAKNLLKTYLPIADKIYDNCK